MLAWQALWFANELSRKSEPSYLHGQLSARVLVIRAARSNRRAMLIQDTVLPVYSGDRADPLFPGGLVQKYWGRESRCGQLSVIRRPRRLAGPSPR
jgi:hypothetical protein